MDELKRLEPIVGPLLLQFLGTHGIASLLAALICVHCANNIDGAQYLYCPFDALCIAVMFNAHTSCLECMERWASASEICIRKIGSRYAVQIAAERGNVPFMSYLLANGYNPTRETYSIEYDEQNSTTLMLKHACPCIDECKKGDDEYHISCIIHEYDIQLVDTILRNVITRGYIGCLMYLLRYIPSILQNITNENEREYMAHMYTRLASSNGKLDCLKVLIEKDYPVHVEDCIMVAFINRHLLCMEYLLDMVCDDEQRSHSICTEIIFKWYNHDGTYEHAKIYGDRYLDDDDDFQYNNMTLPELRVWLDECWKVIQRRCPGHAVETCDGKWPCTIEKDYKHKQQAECYDHTNTWYDNLSPKQRGIDARKRRCR